MDGWQVMAAPLAVLVQLGALATAGIGSVWLVRRVLEGSRDRPGAGGRPSARGDGPPGTGDSPIVDAYRRALLDGWPPGALATFIEVGRRTGTSGAHVEAVIARRRAA